MLFGKRNKTWDHVLSKEGTEDILHINYEGAFTVPSIEGDPICMMRVLDKLIQIPAISRIVFHQKKNYEYGYNQTQMLIEIANIYNHLIKQKKVLTHPLIFESPRYAEKRRATMQYIVLTLLRSDPLGAYVELRRTIREEKINFDKAPLQEQEGIKYYLSMLVEIFSLLDKTKLISYTKQELGGYEIGNRDLYRTIFRPTVTPSFMFVRLMADPPLDGEELVAYSVDEDTEVIVFKTPRDIKPLYHLMPSEFKISEDKYALIDLAKNVLAEHQPKAEEFLDIEKMRQTFFYIGRDLLTELSYTKRINISYDELNKLADILVRYTVGFGLIEVLLNDKKIQDIVVNGPIGQTPIFIVHEDFGECVTNIIPSQEDGESWATKFKLVSGRPLDEANPVLDIELILPTSKSRVAIVTRPLNPLGYAYSIRRHRDDPWTFPLFIKNRMMNSLAAGLLSFLIDGSRSFLIAGTRSSGKTSLLDSSLLEIIRKCRIITVEDTLELSTDKLRKLGYNIQPMKVRSALLKTGSEVSADEGIRTSLRMGDSSLIVGEIRSTEAFALYEAMRIGALANVVAGTIHGESPYGVFDRVVNDLNVPRTSFKATDLIVIANPVKSPDGLRKWKRIMQITEVRKEWETDPLAEGAFVDLMKYDPKTDELVPTDNLINGDSEIVKSIAASVKEWAGNWDAVWENILLRATIKQMIVDYATKMNIPKLLEAESTVFLNDEFHRISDAVLEKKGILDSKRILVDWESSLKRYIKNEMLG